LPFAEVAAYLNHFARLLIGTCKMLPSVERQFGAAHWTPGKGLLLAVKWYLPQHYCFPLAILFQLFALGSTHI
jgi:hypothetical protein